MKDRATTRIVGLTVLTLTTLLGACRSSAPVVPPAPPAPPPNVKVIFEDDFSAYNPRWRQVRGHWVFQDGALQQIREDAREGNALHYVETITIADADIRTRLTTGAKMPQYQTPEDQEMVRARRLIAGAGVLFRYENENNYYLFRLAGEEGAVLGKMKDGQWYDLANPRAADFLGGSGNRIREGEAYELRVRVQGDRIQCWVNNRAVVNLQDNSFATGKFGVATFRSQAMFDAIRVIEP